MNILREIFQQSEFLKVLFNVIPALSFVIDPEGNVHNINNSAKIFLNISKDFNIPQKAGAVMRCIQAKGTPDDCGSTPSCKKCILRQTGMNAINGKAVNRAKGKLEIELDGKHKTIYFMASSAPFNYKGLNMAIILVEDISDIIFLKGLIPICSSCKEIRADDGYWKRIETYIEDLTDVEFTHDFCPKCIKKLYPDYYKQYNIDIS